ncbi:MAG TPA: type II secretion system F family protein [Vitreimonas sp.]|nr:type II secretion system F family protein [Vitreimonas sp.]
MALLAAAAIAANVLAGALAALVLCASVPLIAAAVLHVLAGRRVRELGSFLPRFFDRVRQLLVIGNSLPTAFARAIDGSHPRLIAFFAPALRRIANGAGFADAIRQSSDDIALYEMHLFAAAVSTNMRFGGSLTHALNNLVRFLQKRASVERELRASTSLIRTSAWVLALLPVLVGALIVTQNQEYARWFVADPLGRSLLVYCAASQIAGVFAMRAITGSEF